MKKILKYDSFIFTHIPKCGGTSFRKLINDSAIASGIPVDKLYVPGFNELSTNKNIDQLNAKEKEEFRGSDYKVIAAHSKYNLHKDYELKTENPFYYTILRDPVKRFISHYHFFYYTLGYDNLKGVSIGELEEEKLLYLVKRLANVQTTYLANFKFKKVLGEENMLKLAKYNLQYEYGAFGLIENMEESMLRVEKILPDWLSMNQSITQLNSSNSNNHEVSSSVIKLIEKHNYSDIELYSFAKERFLEKGTLVHIK